MRKPEEIRADIEKLTKELEAVKIHESRQVAAVNILYNLGWKHDNLKGWQKPASKCSDYKAPLKAGELATWEDGALRGTVYIRSVGNKFSQVSHVRGVSRLGVDVLTGGFAIENSKLTIRPREYFIGRR
ncbi:deoxynucleoside-5 [Klebsiella phage vB_KpnP-VAC71]|uniref:Deoxynucleoside-5 n=1 Tax=Klebsiella phage vB_KpnP-VAC71 TaxID=2866700 RepID=A0AAE8YIQ1_9CAUD|nr:deoxynucleoside-5 [Klebsiella phage vB_KpnP-VAC71]